MSNGFVRYVGGSNVRRITARDWNALGIEHPTVEWSARNGFSVPRSDISDAAWEALEMDPGLVHTQDEPTASVIRDAKIEAASARLLARQEGREVLHAQDPVPGVDESQRNTGA